MLDIRLLTFFEAPIVRMVDSQNKNHLRIYPYCVYTKKSSMIGTGKGGKSIWGKKFEDEIVPHLKVIAFNHCFAVYNFIIFIF